MRKSRAHSTDYYEVLGVSHAATRHEIRDAYRDMLRLFHPDSRYYSDIIDDHPGKKHLDTFMKLREAYEVLRNAEKRSSYDTQLNSHSPAHSRSFVSSAGGTMHVMDDPDIAPLPAKGSLRELAFTLRDKLERIVPFRSEAASICGILALAGAALLLLHFLM